MSTTFTWANNKRLNPFKGGIITSTNSGLFVAAFPGSVISTSNSGQWFSNGNIISSETGTSYTIRAEDIGVTLTQQGSRTNFVVWKPQDESPFLEFYAPNVGAYNSISPNIEATDGQTVTRLLGRALGYSLDQTTSGNRPLRQIAEVNGNDVIQFDGADDFMSASGANLAMFQNKGYGYVIAAFNDTNRAAGDATHALVFYSNNVTATRVGLFTRSGSSAIFAGSYRRLDADTATTISAPSQGGNHVVALEIKWALGSSRLRIDNQPAATGVVTTGLTSNTASGNATVANANAASRFPGNLSALVVCGSTSPITEIGIQRIQAWLALYNGAALTPDPISWNNNSLTGPYTATTATPAVIITPNGLTPTEGSLLSHRYRHHTRIHHGGGTGPSGRTYVMFSSGGTNEDQSGQQAAMCYSDDKGVTWSAPVLICASQSLFSASSVSYESGKRICFPRAFVEYGGSLYAVVAVDQSTGDPPGSAGLIGAAMVAVEILSGGTVGTIFRITPAAYAAIDSKAAIAYDAVLGPPLLAATLVGTWGGSAPGMTASAWQGWYRDSDNVDFAEPTAAVSRDGGTQNLMRLWREISVGQTRLYSSWSNDGGSTWSRPVPTDIPNAPSAPAMLRLSTGEIAVVANQESTRATLYLAVTSPNSTTTSVYSIITGVSTTPVYAGTYKSGGAAYPDIIEVGNYLYASYSLQKENVGFSRVLIPGRPDNNND